MPIIRATNIFRGSIVSEGLIYAHLTDLPLDRAPLLQAGEILVVRSGAYTGDSALITEDWAGSAPGYDLRITPESIDSRFLAYAFLSGPVMHAIDIERSRAAQPHLNAEELGRIRISAPDVGEQRRIADFLEVETARIDEMEAIQLSVRSKLDERDRAVLDLELDLLEDAYGFAPFRRSIVRIEQGASPQCDNVPAEDEEWGVLKVSSVKHGIFWPDENKRLPDEILPERRYEIKEGDLLITRANTPALVGATAVVQTTREKLLLCDKIFRVEVAPHLDPRFLVAVSRGTKIRNLCAAASHGSSPSMANLKTSDIKEWPIPRVDIDTQRQLISRILKHWEVTEGLRSAISAQLDRLAERRQALITAAVTGQIDVTTARGV
ncbi:restriction endonuclease subunit S [Acrocarpospora sp. B8E8]